MQFRPKSEFCFEKLIYLDGIPSVSFLPGFRFLSPGVIKILPLRGKKISTFSPFSSNSFMGGNFLLTDY